MSTIADDVATLRTEVEAHWRDGQLPNYMTTLFDRIADAVPQRATDRHGDLLWQHHCGAPAVGEAGFAPQHCRNRACYSDAGKWRALYTLGGE